MEKKLREKNPTLEFRNEPAFFKFLKTLEDETQWFDTIAPVRLTAPNPNAVPGNATEYLYELSFQDEKTGEIKTAKLNELTAPLSLNERAGVKCVLTAYYFSNTPPDYADLITAGLNALGENLRILIRGGQVLATHSTKYKILPQKAAFNEVNRVMKDIFPLAEFYNGSYCHDLTHLRYSLSNGKDELMKSYAGIWEAAGYPAAMLEKTHPVIDFSTSDTGRYTFSIRPLLFIASNQYPLGSEIHIKHCLNANIDDIKEDINLCYAHLKDGLAAIEKMQDTVLLHPYAAFVRACNHCGLNARIKKIMRGALEDFKDNFEAEEKVTAFNVYRAICDVQDRSLFRLLPESTKLVCLEDFCRLLQLNWPSIDYAGVETI